VVAGILYSYVAYDLTHYWSHFGGSQGWGYFKELKRSHMSHHYQDNSVGYGISTPCWDYVFRTSKRATD